SVESAGIGIQVVIDTPSGPLIGFGSESSDLGRAGIERAFAKARRAAVADPEFRSLPRPRGESRALSDYHDRELMDVGDTALVEAGWRVVQGALRTFQTSSVLASLAGSEEALAKLGLIIGGDVTILDERVAVVSTAMARAQTD